MSESKEPKFKVGQRVCSPLLGIEGEVLQVDNGPVVVVRVRVDRGRNVDYACRVWERSLEPIEDEGPSLPEVDFFELEQRIAACYIKAAHPIFVIDGFNRLRADLDADSTEEPSEPAVEAMSLLESLRESLNSIRAKAMNLPGLGVMTNLADTFDHLNDLSEVIDELIEQRDAARAEGPEYEFTEDGRTIAPLFVPPGSVATWLFGRGLIETGTGHVDGKKYYEFRVAEKPAKPGDVLTGDRSREPAIRVVFHDDEAIHRLIRDLQNLANVVVRRRANVAE